MKYVCELYVCRMLIIKIQNEKRACTFIYCECCISHLSRKTGLFRRQFSQNANRVFEGLVTVVLDDIMY